MFTQRKQKITTNAFPVPEVLKTMEDQKKRKQARDLSGCFVRNEQSHKAPCISGDVPFVLFVCSLVTSLLSLWWAQGHLLCLVCPPFLACIDFRIVHPPGSRSRRHLCSLALECSLQSKAKMTLESMDSQDAQRVQRMRTWYLVLYGYRS